MDDAVVRQSLEDLLTQANAHVSTRRSLENVATDKRDVRPTPETHSVWEQLEHMRIAQEDILRYTLDSSWRSPEWPAGYWPLAAARVTDEEWSRSIARLFADLDEVVAIARSPNVDLTAPIPHGEGRTYLRQILLVADHNAYHVGQIVVVRRLLGDWRD